MAWDPVRQLTGKNMNQLVQGRVNNLGNQITLFLNKPVDYTLKLPLSVLTDVCSLTALRYEGTLAGAADGKWKRLPPELVAALQPYYDVNLGGVQYATVHNLPGNFAMTFGNRIYFPARLDLQAWKDLFWMTHELEHVVQYARSGPVAKKLCEYQLKAIGAFGQHDNIDMERAADRKAGYVVSIAYQAMNAPQRPPTGLPTSDPASPMGTRAPPTGTLSPQDEGSPIVQDTSSENPPRDHIFTGLAPNSIWIANETFQTVYFELRSRTFPGGAVALPPRSAQVFWGNYSDRDFQIRIVTGNTELMYVLPAQTQQHIDWNQSGILDVFYD
jgi:hypothetical protein